MFEARIAPSAEPKNPSIDALRFALGALNTKHIGHNRKNAIQNYYQYY